MKINKRTPNKKIIIIAAIVLVIACGVTVYALVHNQNQNSIGKGTYNPTTMNPSSNVPKPDNTQGNGGITQSQNPNPSPAPTPSSDAKPLAPVGTFASSHHVSLSTGAVEQSTCSTTPGAQCQIVFTVGSVKKTLPAQTTDGNGNTQWTWNTKDIGFSAGEWTITATATIGSNTSSSTDALKLEISQ